MDSLDVIATLASRFGVRRCLGVRGVRQVWSLIRLQIVDSSEAEVQGRARSCLRHLIRLAAEEEEEEEEEEEASEGGVVVEGAGGEALSGVVGVDDLLAGSPMAHLMKQIKMQCMVDVKSPEEARARRGASALMCAISAHPRAARLVLAETLEALRNIVVAPAKGTAVAPLVRQQAALECMLQAVMSARALWAYMSKEGKGREHPLVAGAAETFECAASVVQYPGGESEESATAKLAALDVLTELVTDEGVVAGELEAKAACIACHTLSIAQTNEAREKCKQVVIKIATAYSASSSRRDVLVADCIVPPLLQTLMGVPAMSTGRHGGNEADMDKATSVTLAGEVLGSISALSEASLSRAMPELLRVFEPTLYRRAWQPCPYSERAGRGKQSMLAVLQTLRHMAPARAQHLKAMALAAVLDPLLAAVAAAPPDASKDPCAETLEEVATLLRMVLVGLPGDGESHQELVRSLWVQLVPAHWSGAAARIEGGTFSGGSGGGRQDADDARLLGILCAALELCHGSTLVGFSGQPGQPGASSEQGPSGASTTGQQGPFGAASDGLVYGLLEVSMCACRKAYPPIDEAGPRADLVPLSTPVRGLVCLLNKLPDDQLGPLLDVIVNIAGQTFSQPASGAGAASVPADLRAIAALAAAAAAAVLARGHKRGAELVNLFYKLLEMESRAHASAGAEAFGIMSRWSEAVGLRKDGHAFVKRLWRQKVWIIDIFLLFGFAVSLALPGKGLSLHMFAAAGCGPCSHPPAPYLYVCMVVCLWLLAR